MTFSFRISDVERLNRQLSAHRSELRRRLRPAMEAIGDRCVSESSRLAPYDTGALSDSIVREVGTDSSGALCTVVKVPSDAPCSAYAVAMHEDEYVPGERSLLRDPSSGRKYLLRGVTRSSEDFFSIIKQHMERS